MDGRCVLIGGLCLLSASGCYRSHERGPDAGIPDAQTIDTGRVVPICNPRDPGLGCEPATAFGVWTARVPVDGVLHDVCFCAPGACTERWGCTWHFLAGDDAHLVCAEREPPVLVGGRCVRECESHEDCPAGMLCLALEDVRGVTYDRERACFYASPVP